MRSDNMPREADIVERLHEFADRMTARRYPGNADFIRAVAEEIERLREIERENDGVIAVWRRRCNVAEDERDKLREDVEKLTERCERFRRLDCEAAQYVELPIIQRTHFTGEEPYVGWEGIGLALTETLDRYDALRAKIEAAPKCRVYEAQCLGFDDPDRDEITDIVKGRMLVKLVKCDD